MKGDASLRPTGGSRRFAWAPLGAAVLTFAIGLVATFGTDWPDNAHRAVPVAILEDEPMTPARKADVIFETWLVARNARALLEAPHRFFEAEHCAPAEKSVTFGVPMVTLGLLGIPAYLATGDPLWTYNSTLVLSVLLAAMAMFLLVSDWTRSATAGIVAGLLYAFHATRLGVISHPSVVDTTWTVFALYFAQRLFSRGRWRDAVGLGAACALQIAASFYPFLGAVFLSLPFGVWLLRRYGFRAVRPAQLALVAGCIALAGAFVFGPYLEVRGETEGFRRAVQYFADWRSYRPGRLLFPGWILLALAVAGAFAPKTRALRLGDKDPRWALAVGAVLVALLAAGPNTDVQLRQALGWLPFAVPDFYGLLAKILPGLDAIRGVSRIAISGVIVWCAFAGMGVAALLGLFGRRRSLATAVLVGWIGLTVLWPEARGVARIHEWVWLDIRPDDDDVQFFADLAALGNDGAVLELPFDREVLRLTESPPRILLSFYHRRRTTSCFGSYQPERRHLEGVADQLPNPESVRELLRMGFRTVVLYHRHYRGVIRSAAGVEQLLASEEITAYALSDPGPKKIP